MNAVAPSIKLMAEQGHGLQARVVSLLHPSCTQEFYQTVQHSKKILYWIKCSVTALKSMSYLGFLQFRLSAVTTKGQWPIVFLLHGQDALNSVSSTQKTGAVWKNVTRLGGGVVLFIDLTHFCHPEQKPKFAELTLKLFVYSTVKRSIISAN